MYDLWLRVRIDSETLDRFDQRISIDLNRAAVVRALVREFNSFSPDRLRQFLVDHPDVNNFMAD